MSHHGEVITIIATPANMQAVCAEVGLTDADGLLVAVKDASACGACAFLISSEYMLSCGTRRANAAAMDPEGHMRKKCFVCVGRFDG